LISTACRRRLDVTKIHQRQRPETFAGEETVMRMPRFSIGGLMGVVLVASIGLAALRSASEIWAGVMFLVTCGMLALAVVGVVCRRDEKRAWWLGFALFGWGYLALAFWSSEQLPWVPTMYLLEGLMVKLGAPPPGRGKLGVPFAVMFQGPHSLVGQCLWSLLAATIGGLLARALFATPAARVDNVDAVRQPAGQYRRNSTRRLVVLILVGLLLIASLGLAGSRWIPVLWAAAPFLLTWGLLGLTVIGAFFGRGKSRTVWLGAALFGVGYMILIFGGDPQQPTWPRLATEQLLHNLSPSLPPGVREFPASSDSIAAANARIRRSLEQLVPMRFPNETPLEDILGSIKAATKGADARGIAIYVDQEGLDRAEKTMTSPIAIDVEGIPLKTSLYLALKQLGLGYRVKGGLLLISDEGEAGDVYEDPFLLAGHCMLALLAAGLGGLLAPLVVDRGELA